MAENRGMTDWFDPAKYEGHTEGDWEALDSTEENPLPAGPPVSVGRKPGRSVDCVCDMRAQGDGKYDPEVTWANARLIADAPRLLDEVVRLREENKRWRDGLEDVNVIETLRAQVAKLKQDFQEMNDIARANHDDAVDAGHLVTELREALEMALGYWSAWGEEEVAQAERARALLERVKP